MDHNHHHEDAAPLPGKAEVRRVLTGLSLAMLLSALDQTIVVTAMPTIGADLGDVERLPWIVTAYLVASTAVTPLYGKLADIHGRRVMLLTGIAIFILGSIACALSPSIMVLSLARVLQGCGGGGLISLAQTIVADIVTPRERGRYQTFFAAVFVVSSVAGPVLGGAFAHYLRWSWIFWINIPLGLIAFAIVNTTLARLPVRRHPHRVDYLGATLLVAASGLLVVALGQGKGARAEPTAILLLGSALCWALFVWRSRRVEEPFIPLSFLTQPIARNSALSGAFGLGAFIGLSSVAPIYFEGALGLSPDGSGVALIPMMIASVIGATLAGRSMTSVRHYKRMPIIGLALGVVAALALAEYLGQLSLLEINALLFVLSVGIGAVLPVSTVSTQNTVAPRDLGAATAVMQFSRQIACALIVALLGGIVMSGGGAMALEGEHTQAATKGLTEAFRLVFYVVAMCEALSCLFLIRMEEKPLRESKGA